MLASSFLISAARILPGTPSPDPSAPAGEAEPGFAALLDQLAALVTGATPSDAPATPATAAEAADEGGKDLPVGLPQPAEAGDEATLELDSAGLINDPLLVLAMPGQPNPALAGATPRAGRPATSALPKGAVAPESIAVAESTKAKSIADGQKPEGRQGPAVSVAVAPAPAGVEPTEALAPLKARTGQVADAARSEAALAHVTPASPAFVDARQPATATGPVMAPALAPLPTPVDINAALDQLVAAREALMPAETALAIDHAEFGEVSIRIEQKADGRLSAELAGADPELHRAVTAAVAADRGSAAGSESDGGRSTLLPGQRNPGNGGDAAAGERRQAGDEPQRRGMARDETRTAPGDPNPGVFA